MSGTSAPTDQTDRNANCAVATSTYTGVATRATASEIQNARDTARNRAPWTRATAGRAITVRSTKRPMAVMNERKVSQRNVSRPGVVAGSESDGMTNCGGGPGFGPTLNVNAPRTGCPSTEITRQKTRYQPSRTRFSG